MQEIESSYTSILGLVLSAFKLISLSYLLEHIACFGKISNSFPKDFDVVNKDIFQDSMRVQSMKKSLFRLQVAKAETAVIVLRTTPVP